MKAPEKVYRTTTYLNSERGNTVWKSEPVRGAENIEYVCKDAFIEKALKFLDENFFFNNVHHSIESGVFESKEEMFDYFINYVKGE